MAAIRHKAVLELTPAEIKRCCQLTLPKGTMRGCLLKLRLKNDTEKARAEKSIVVLAEAHGRIVGWLLLFPNYSKKFEAYFFVDPDMRRQGIGRQLAEAGRALKPRHKLLTRPHDRRSVCFFDSLPQQRFVPQGSAYRLQLLRLG